MGVDEPTLEEIDAWIDEQHAKGAITMLRQKIACHFYHKGQQDLKNSKDVAEWQLEYLEELKENGWKSPEEWASKRIDEDCADENRAYLKKKIAELEAANAAMAKTIAEQDEERLSKKEG